MKSSRFRLRLAAAFCLLAAVLVAVGLQGINHLSRLNLRMETVVRDRWVQEQLSHEAFRLSNINSRITLLAVLIEDQATLKQLLVERSSNTDRISEIANTLAPRLDTKAALEKFAAVQAARIPYVESYKKALSLLAADKRDEARQMMIDTVRPRLITYHDAWNAFDQEEAEEINQAFQQSQTEYADSRRDLLLTLVLAGLITGAIAGVTIWRIGREVAVRQRAEEALQSANDQLENRVHDRTAELERSNEALKEEIVERHRAEHLLRMGEARFANAFEYAAIGKALVEPEGNFIKVNQALCALLGYSTEGLMAKTFRELTHPDDLEVDHENIRKLLEGEILTYQIEKRYLHRDGHPVWGLLSVSLIRNEQGHPLHFIAQVQDIAERKLAMERLDRIFTLSPDMILTASFDGYLKQFNPAVERILGYTKEELLAAPFENFTHPEDQTAVAQAIERSISNGSLLEFESRCLCKDRTWRWLQSNSVAVPGEQLFYVVARDITERKLAEEQIARLRTEHELVLNSVGEGVHWVAVDGSIKFENPAAAKMLGYEVAELLGQPAHSTMHHTRADGTPFPVCECLIYATLRDGIPRRANNEVFWRKDGTSFPVEYACTSIRDKDDQPSGAVVIFTDITERRRAEAEMEHMHSQLVDTSRRAGMAEVATSVLHNVGNVLNSVNVSSSLVADRIKKSKISSLSKATAMLAEHRDDLGTFLTDDPKGKQLPDYLDQLSRHLIGEQSALLGELNLLHKNVDHIKDIVAMQQRYAKISGVVEMVRIGDMVDDALHMQAVGMERHGVTVSVECGDISPITVEKHKLLQVLVNLIHNAKHSCNASNRSDKKVLVRVAEAEGNIDISVIDNGVGISQENLTRIFAYGFTTRKDGHGFGLHSGALAAKEMGGSLVAQSQGLGDGATFTLQIPCMPPKLHELRDARQTRPLAF